MPISITSWLASLEWHTITIIAKGIKVLNNIINKEISLHISQHKCTACEACFEQCPHQVIGMVYKEERSYATVEYLEKCVGCNQCVDVCQTQAIELYGVSKQLKTNKK